MIKRNIGNNIKDARNNTGMSQRDVAKLLNISNATIASWEVNRTEPSMEMISRLSMALNVDMAQLIGITDGPASSVIEFLTKNSDYPETLIELINICRNMPEQELQQVLSYATFIDNQNKCSE